MSEKIKALESGELDNIIPNNEELLNELKTLKTNQDVVHIASTISSIANVSIQAIEAFGILKGKDLQNASAALNALGNAAGAVANFYSGNYIGMVSNVINIFTGFGKPQESPEVQMLKQVMEQLGVMDTKLNHLIEVVHEIDRKLVELGKMIEALHIDMMRGFESTNVEIQQINDQLRDLTKIVWQNAIKEFSSCHQLDIEYNTNYSLGFTSYDDLVNFRESIMDSDFNPCMNAIKNTLSTNPLRNQQISSIMNIQWDDEGLNYLKNIWNPIFKIFKETYGESNQFQIQSLLYPVEFSHQQKDISSWMINEIINGSKEVPKILSTSTLQLNEDLLNPYSLIALANLYLKYDIFYEVSQRQDYVPHTIDNYLELQTTTRLIGQKDKLSNLLLAINSSIIQQSLLSGSTIEEHLYTALSNFNTNIRNQELLKLLENNAYLNRNLGIFILRREYLQKKENFSKWYKDEEVKKLEFSNNKIVISKESNGLINMEFKLLEDKNYVIKGLSWNDAISGRRYYPESLIQLKQLRNRIVEKLIDIEYKTNLVDSQNTTNLDFFNIQCLNYLSK